jgi:hypothetical protein
MTVPMKVEINCETGVISEVPLSDAELAQLEIDRANAEADCQAREAEAQAIADAKVSAEAKLTSLGLSADEIAALGK